jgi:putative DNA primase/helicase
MYSGASAMISNEDIAKAAAVRFEDVLSQRGVTLHGNRFDGTGPCPQCGGTVAETVRRFKEQDRIEEEAERARGKEATDSRPFWEDCPRAAKASITFLDAEALEMEIIEWLWLHWLARGKLHLIAGAPEAGKTTIALALAAIVSAGERWPDGARAKPGNVLIWTSEDGLADTIKPRLVRMGADLRRIKFVYQQKEEGGKLRPFCPATDMGTLADAVREIGGGIALLIIDPIVAAIGSKTNSHNNAETRNSLQPVVDFSEMVNCAVLGISHFTKGTAGKDPVERVTGSLAFGALPRIVFAAAKDDNGNSPRIFVRAKSNIGPSGGGFGFDIDAAPLMERPDIVATRVAWGDPIEGTAKELLDEAEPKSDGRSKAELAENFLKMRIQPGERYEASAIEEEAKACGIQLRTLKRAKSAAKVMSVQENKKWWWTRY